MKTRKAGLHDPHFLNEDAKYRKARNDLLKAEIVLRRQTEKVAALLAFARVSQRQRHPALLYSWRNYCRRLWGGLPGFEVVDEMRSISAPAGRQ